MPLCKVEAKFVSDVKTATHGRGYLPTLDGWRALAVSFVIARHYLLGRQCLGNSAPAWCGGATVLGMKGVALFFGISGFLIRSRLLEEWHARGTISLRAFYTRRAFRILPPALWYLFVVALLGISGVITVSVREWIAALTFWRDYGFGSTYGWYTGHYWLLSVEEKFYLFWPVLLVFVGSRRAFKFGAALALSVGLWRIADGHWRITEHAFHLPLYSLTFRWDTRLDALLYGCLLAILLDAPHRRKWAIDHTNQWVQLACVASVIGIVAEARIQPGIASVLEAMAIPVMIASTVLAPYTVLGRVLESRILVWFGRLSYSIYLWQQLFLDEVDRPLRIFQWGPVALISILCCALISYYGIERPFVRLGHKLAPPVTPGRPDSESERGSLTTREASA